MAVWRRLCVLVVVACSIVVPLREAQAFETEAVQAMFVGDGDVPDTFTRQPDTPPSTSAIFAKHGGERALQRTFSHADGRQFIVDQRYIFASAEAAGAFLQEAAAELSGGLPSTLIFGNTLGKESKRYQETQEPFLTTITLFRVGPVVARVRVTQRKLVGDSPMPSIVARERMLRQVAEVAHERTQNVVSPSGPPAPAPAPQPQPPRATTLVMPIGGWRVTLPGVWRVTELELTYGKVNMLSRRNALRTEVEISVSVRPGTSVCTTSPTPSIVLSPIEIAGFDRAGQSTGSDIYGCAQLRGVTLRVGVTTRNPEEAVPLAQRILAAARDHYGAAPPPAPTHAEPTPWTPPSPSPSAPPADDGERWDAGFPQPHFVGVRLSAAIGYLDPDDAREGAFGIGVAAELGVVTHRLIGFAADVGMSVGYGFDGNVPVDVHAGVGPGLGLGPLSLVPLIGLGVNTRGGGDEIVTHTMDAALYWYPGGRLRLRLDPVTLDAYATVAFRGSIEADAATDVTRIIRLLLRLGFRPDGGSQAYHVGFQYEGLQGAVDGGGVALYPGATQLGAVAGIGFFLDELVD